LEQRVTRLFALRHQLFIALVAPAVIAIVVTAYFADVAARRALESALGDRLCSIAQAAGTIVGPQVLLLEKGDDDTRSSKNALAKLSALIRATGVDRIFIARIEGAATVLDSRDELKIGDPYERARFDQEELGRVVKGESVSSVLFEGRDGIPYKTGYAPLPDEQGVVAAYVGVNARAGFYEAIVELRKTMIAIAVLGSLLLVIMAVISARQVSVPLSRLSEAAVEIGKGKLDTAVPSGGPKEAEILANTMRDMTRSLAARDEEMQMMLAGIAHEVRNPLGGIELFGGLLREDLEEGDPRRKHVDKILKELAVLRRVVSDFLDFARRTVHEKKPTPVRDLLLEVVSISQKDAGETGIELTIDAPAELSFPLDPDAIKRAVLNLVRNAIQASSKGAKIEISAHIEGPGVSLVVQDHGPGIAPEKRIEIFTPFYTTKQKGTGLGLALVKKTVEAHGGAISVEETPGGGARFVIVLPR
jgi:signal transduction histidine kinase